MTVMCETTDPSEMVLEETKKKNMTRIGRRLIEDFLLPALNDERYGELLKWIDRDKCYFSIRWSHKNAAKWTLADTAVFQDWDRLKGHYHPEVKGYYMQAKQRFRAALYKLNTVRKLPCEDKHVKKYQLVLNPDKKHHEIMPRKAHRMHREENQKSIPTPVICRNTSFIAKASSYEESYSSPSSPEYCVKSESCDKTDEDLNFEYRNALNQQRRQSTDFCQPPLKTVKLEDHSVCPSAVLRESPEMNSVRKTPHVPLQLVPVYSKLNGRQTVDSSQKRYESPRVLLVPTYNETDMDISNSHEKDTIPVLCNQEKETIPGLCNMHADKQNSDGVLNLSVKNDDSEILSR